MPRFYFDIEVVGTVRDDEGHELADLDAARRHVRRVLGTLLAHELRRGGSALIGVHVRDEAGERVATLVGRGEVSIDEMTEASAGERLPQADGCTPSPLVRAANHAVAAQGAIQEDGDTSLRHHAEMLRWAIGRMMMRRLAPKTHPRL
ncbi:DUF6894 family protein [Methylobacterium radiodurans]|uniref:DUF6894 domain-containing protein n=1 Tax=Methylobacterium radiodurans TaxID=2202828 RepID=A0A2U8VYN3_9HYPH|nr:hypothetical protein [Methylobacterium radiodurans]AWN38362.1 hypothetical protein DK427_23645 [Methylobacterium radiodurans]